LSVGLPGPLKIECYAAREGPQIEPSADKFRAVVEPDHLWAANLSDNSFQCVNDSQSCPSPPTEQIWIAPRPPTAAATYS